MSGYVPSVYVRIIHYWLPRWNYNLQKESDHFGLDPSLSINDYVLSLFPFPALVVLFGLIFIFGFQIYVFVRNKKYSCSEWLCWSLSDVGCGTVLKNCFCSVCQNSVRPEPELETAFAAANRYAVLHVVILYACCIYCGASAVARTGVSTVVRTAEHSAVC